MLKSDPGPGSEFVLNLPLSLTTTLRMLTVRVGSELLALPTGSIDRVVRVEPGDGRLVSSGGLQAVVLVDAIDEEQEVVVKPLGDHLREVPNIAGATVLASGRIVPVLSIPDVVRSARGLGTTSPPFRATDAPQARPRRILIVDSITTRTLEKSILECHTVEVATDGVEAIGLLKQRPFDLVLSDVQMPRMDGIELVTHLKGSEEHRSLPVVLVSSLASDDDMKRGLQSGADACIGKAEFRQEALLETLERLL